MNTVTFDIDRLAAVHQYAQEQISADQFAGIAWSLHHNDKLIDEGVFGYADHARSKPLQSDAIYRLYSMTKPVISLRCLQLVEDGKLRLDDPVSRWIPAFAKQKVLSADGRQVIPSRPMTIEDLLTHRSGLSYDFLPDCPIADQYRDAGLAANGHRPLSELVDILANLPLAFEPGERWYYSYATDVLAHVIERVCDKALDEDLHQALFSPLLMHETDFRIRDDQQHRLADMFGQRELGEVAQSSSARNQLLPMDVEQSYPSSGVETFLRGGIGLFSTISDYQLFLYALMHGRTPEGRMLLSAPMLNLLWQNRLTAAQMPINIGGKDYMGYGWGLAGRILVDPGASLQLSVPGEGGWAGAASTHFWVDRSNNISGVVMTQFLGSNIPLGFDIQSLCYAALENSSSQLPGTGL